MKIINKTEIQELLPVQEAMLDQIPLRFKESWLEDCHNSIKQWAESPKDKQGLFIFGECGTGKTYSLYALYRNAVLEKVDCRIINETDLIRLFKSDFDKNFDKNKNEEGHFDNYLNYKGTLFIDDVGTEKKTEFTEETLYHIINTRYENMLDTLFTSNLSPKELAERNGDRLASRIVGMCDVVELKGYDKRFE